MNLAERAARELMSDPKVVLIIVGNLFHIVELYAVWSSISLFMQQVYASEFAGHLCAFFFLAGAEGCDLFTLPVYALVGGAVGVILGFNLGIEIGTTLTAEEQNRNPGPPAA